MKINENTWKEELGLSSNLHIDAGSNNLRSIKKMFLSLNDEKFINSSLIK